MIAECALQVVWVQTLCMSVLVSYLDWTAEAVRAAALVSKSAAQRAPPEGRDLEEG